MRKPSFQVGVSPVIRRGTLCAVYLHVPWKASGLPPPARPRTAVSWLKDRYLVVAVERLAELESGPWMGDPVRISANGPSLRIYVPWHLFFRNRMSQPSFLPRKYRKVPCCLETMGKHRTKLLVVRTPYYLSI